MKMNFKLPALPKKPSGEETAIGKYPEDDELKVKLRDKLKNLIGSKK